MKGNAIKRCDIVFPFTEMQIETRFINLPKHLHSSTTFVEFNKDLSKPTAFIFLLFLFFFPLYATLL
jgi:hypothetical protein